MKTMRILSLVLALLMVLGLAACSSTPATNEPSAPAETPAADSTTTEPADEPAEKPADTTEAPADEPAEAPADEPADDYDALVAEGHMGTIVYNGFEVGNFPITPATNGSGALTLPLVDEPTTLSVFVNFGNKYLASPADVIGNQVVEEQTGVSIDWQTYTESDQLNLFYASGMYTDILFGQKTSYSGGIDKAIEDEVFVPANDYFDYTPNFKAMLAADHTADIQSKTDSGNYYFSSIQTGNEPAWCGPMVRTDWLEDCGLDTPLTYDDWYEMLIAFRDQKGSTGAMTNAWGFDYDGYGLISGYHTYAGFYAKDGKEIRFGFLDDSMFDYVSMLNKWLNEGLINPDFISMNVWANFGELYCSEVCGAFEMGSYTFKPTYEAALAGDKDILDAVPLPAQTEEESGTLHFRRYNHIIGDSASYITTGAVERGTDVLAAQWLDYRYSQDGFYALNYGREGLSYEFGEDGWPHFTDYVLNNPDGIMAQDMRDNVAYARIGGSFYSWLYGYDFYPAEDLTPYDIWSNSASGDWVLPPVTLTIEESEAHAAVFGDVQTYCYEMLLRFIVGDAPLSDWESFVANIESMDIQTSIDCYQSALDRYNAR